MAMIESFLGRGVFFTEGSPYFNRIDMVFYKGHFYCDKQPLLQLYSIMILCPVHFFLKFNHEYSKAILYYLATLFSTGLSCLSIYFILERIFKLLNIEKAARAWTSTAVFFGSALLPFSVTYSNHLVEAALVLATFYMILSYRIKNNLKAPVFSALFLGLATLIHMVAGSLFTVLTGIYFLSTKLSDFFRFFLCSLMILIAGIGINLLVQKNIYFFTMTPEYYLYEKSFWFTYPAIPNLSREKIIRRYQELGISQNLTQITLYSYDQYLERTASLWAWAKKNFLRYNFITFNPIFCVGLLSLIRGLFKGSFRYKREMFWALAGACALYTAVLLARNDHGESFGNRHLLTIVPLTVFFTAYAFKNQQQGSLLKVLTVLCFCMMAPGVLSPWRVGHPYFLKMNLFLGSFLTSVYVLAEFIRGFRRISECVCKYLLKNWIILFFLSAVLLGIELTLWRMAP